MPDIVVTEFMKESALEGFGDTYNVLYDPSLVERSDDLLGLLGDCQALIVRNLTQVREDVLSAGPKLKAIGRLGVGLDNIDLAACEARGIAECAMRWRIGFGRNADAVSRWLSFKAFDGRWQMAQD